MGKEVPQIGDDHKAGQLNALRGQEVILDQKEKSSGKPGEIQIKPVDQLIVLYQC